MKGAYVSDKILGQSRGMMTEQADDANVNEEYILNGNQPLGAFRNLCLTAQIPTG